MHPILGVLRRTTNVCSCPKADIIASNKARFDLVAFDISELEGVKENGTVTLWALKRGTALVLLAGLAVIAGRRKAKPSTA